MSDNQPEQSQPAQSNNQSLDKLFQVLFNLGQQEQKCNEQPCQSCPCPNKEEEEESEEESDEDETTHDEWSTFSSLLETHDNLCRAFLLMVEQKYSN